MELMEEQRLNKKYKYYLIGFNLFICIVVMKTFVINKHFSVDEYSIYYQPYDSILSNISSNMRPVGSIIYYLINVIGINVVDHQILFGLLLIGIFTWCSTRISTEIIQRRSKCIKTLDIFFVNSGVLILLLNAFLSELLYFAAAYTQWSVALWGVTYASIYISKTNNKLRNWLLGTIALTISAGTYQIFIAQYAFIVMTFIFIHYEGKINIKSFFSILQATIAAFIAIAINVICSNILLYIGVCNGNSRVSTNLSKVPELISDIFRHQKNIWIDGLNIYPKYMLAFTLLLLVVGIYFAMHAKKASFSEFFFVAIILISGHCTIYAAQIAQGFIWFSPRNIYPIFGIYTVGIWVIYFYSQDLGLINLKKVGLFVISIFLLYSIFAIDKIASDTIKTNIITNCYAKEIGKKIHIYEQQNQKEITKVGFCFDSSISYRYYEFISPLSYAGNICENPFIREWSDVTSLNYYNNRNFMRTTVPEDISQFYEAQNWDEANWDEQLFFDDDAVYICVF